MASALIKQRIGYTASTELIYRDMTDASQAGIVKGAAAIATESPGVRPVRYYNEARYSNRLIRIKQSMSEVDIPASATNGSLWKQPTDWSAVLSSGYLDRALPA